MPLEDVDMLNGQGQVAESLIMTSPIRLTQFTGSSRIAEHLSEKTRGKVKIEDAGFDWHAHEGSSFCGKSIVWIEMFCF